LQLLLCLSESALVADDGLHAACSWPNTVCYAPYAADSPSTGSADYGATACSARYMVDSWPNRACYAPYAADSPSTVSADYGATARSARYMVDS
jgi:hypothetical protein